MAAIEGSHAPNNECSHLLHPAGYQNPIPKNVFRYNRVTPYYPPDPCISPTEGDLMCPPDEVPPMRNHAWMPAAGNDIRPPSDAFRYYKVFPPATGNRCKPGNQQECPDNGPVCQVDVCPCTHRCPVTLGRRPYDLKHMYPKCVDREPTPHFVNPLFYETTPYISWPSTSPHQKLDRSWDCRVPFSKHLVTSCPNSDPSIGPNIAMFLRCRNY